MEKKINKAGEHTGYDIGKGDILIHNHIDDPEHWLLTIRKLGIMGKTFIKKTATEKEVAQAVYKILEQKREEILPYIRLVSDFI